MNSFTRLNLTAFGILLAATLYDSHRKAQAAPIFFYCDSTEISPITVNLNFSEWFDEAGNRGEARFGQDEDSVELSYLGKLVSLKYKDDRSTLSFSDGKKIRLRCESWGTGQTPGE